MVGRDTTTWGAVLKGHGVRKIEDHCSGGESLMELWGTWGCQDRGRGSMDLQGSVLLAPASALSFTKILRLPQTLVVPRPLLPWVCSLLLTFFEL